MIDTIVSAISHPAIYAILASVALGIIRSPRKKPSGHKKVQARKHQVRIKSAQQQQQQQQPTDPELEVWINQGYVIESIDPLVLRHKDHPVREI